MHCRPDASERHQHRETTAPPTQREKEHRPARAGRWWWRRPAAWTASPAGLLPLLTRGRREGWPGCVCGGGNFASGQISVVSTRIETGNGSSFSILRDLQYLNTFAPLKTQCLICSIDYVTNVYTQYAKFSRFFSYGIREHPKAKKWLRRQSQQIVAHCSAKL